MPGAGAGKTILVTGGGGYIGSHCIHELLLEDYNVVAVDNFVNSVPDQCKPPRESPTGSPESLVRVTEMTGKPVTFYKANLCDQDSLRVPFQKHKIDGVVHLAALKAVGESCDKPLMYYANNVTGSANLMQVMEEFQVRKLVFSSSSCVYGNPEYLPIDENHPAGVGITNPYGRTKYFTEEIIKDVCNANKEWGTVLLRYFNPIGSHPSGNIGEDPQGIPNNLMPFIAQVAVGRRDKLTVYGSDYDTVDGTGVRDYLHVMDLAIGHVLALNKLLDPEFRGVNIYNLGTGRGVSVLEMVHAFEEASGVKIPTVMADRRAGDVSSSYATCDLAEKELGFKCKYTLFDMCKDTWTWQSKNPKGFVENS